MSGLGTMLIACCAWIAYLPFCIVWLCYFIDPMLIEPYLITFAFISVWFGFIIEFGNSLLSYQDAKMIQPYLLNATNNIMIGSISDNNFLNKLNKYLQIKRNNLNKEYRLRKNGLIAEIISPNHVSIDEQIYDSYINQKYNINELKQQFLEDRQWLENRQEEQEPLPFFQWIPTEFRLGFLNSNNSPLSYKDVTINDVKIELISHFIPDINQYEYPELNDIIIESLKRILPLFILSITVDDNYKKLLFKWCLNKKILKFIVKSQQHEISKNLSEYNYNPQPFRYESNYHIEGSLQERIASVGLIYTQVDNHIRGGNLHLRSNIKEYKQDWKLKPFQGSMVVFPNMPHCIKDLTCWDCNIYRNGNYNNNQYPIRRTLIFFMINDNDSWEQSKTYEWMTNLDIDRNDYRDIYQELPIISASEMLPINKKHFEKIFENILFGNIHNIFNIILPDIVIEIIKAFIIDNELLKNEEEQYQNALNMRESRGYGHQYFNYKVKFMN